jgi:hypothetical protein
MRNWIFLSKGLEDPYINDFAKGCGVKPVDSNTFDYNSSEDPIVVRGILKKKFIHKCWEDNRDFFYVDTGYFGNERTQRNPNGWKYWHRIVKNNLQHDKIIKRPADRFKTFNKKFSPWKKDGRKILIAAPDENDVYALVTFNSNAAVESVFHGVPVFTLAPASAAAPVGLNDLSQIETPYYPDQDKLFEWGCHLAYGQFHISELKSGAAKRMLEEQ